MAAVRSAKLAKRNADGAEVSGRGREQSKTPLCACELSPADSGVKKKRKRVREREDWMFDATEFRQYKEWLHQEHGLELQLDACAHPSGCNSHLPEWCSREDSFLARDVAGLVVWMNPPYSRMEEFLHYTECKARQPSRTACMLVVPEWKHKAWWQQLEGWQTVKR